MKFIVTLSVLVYCYSFASAQSYVDSIAKFRAQYVRDLLAEKRKPIEPKDTKYIRFFNPDVRYKLLAEVVQTQGRPPFLVQTHSGKQKTFTEYGTLNFVIDGENYQLHAYQILDPVSGNKGGTELFVPFNDLTNYETTYGGGRYLDLDTKDIINGYIVVDFNKCYNPYCAYSEGFSCPIPPAKNRLRVAIPAGEKMFTKYLAEQ
jgi:uncharacterized protein